VIRRLTAAPVVVVAIACATLCGSPAVAADKIRDEQWHLKFLNIADAHKISTGKGVTVAVIDTGVAKHRDLDGSILEGADFTSDKSDGTKDVDGHGTKMAGLIAAHGKDGSGALGIAPDAKIMPIRVLKLGSAKNLPIGQGIQYAISHGAKVINISAGGGTDPATINAVNDAAKADVVVVASAGNRPEDTNVIAPAIFGSVVAVGATNETGERDKVSATGPEIDILAPGANIEGIRPNNTYGVGTGTSDSSAIVAGAAALIRSKFPQLSAKEVVKRLEDTATDKGAPGVDDEYGHGVLNLVAALADPAGGTPTPTGAAPASTGPATNAAGPSTDKSSGVNTVVLVGGLLACLTVVAAAVIALLVVRRRRPQAPPSGQPYPPQPGQPYPPAR
jgi:type VII secretion-associated serine protease mycosin